MRFLLDEDLNLAAEQKRIFATRNRDDFILLTVEAFRTGGNHEGVLVVPTTPPNHSPERIAHALRRWHDDHPASGTHLLDFRKS